MKALTYIEHGKFALTASSTGRGWRSDKWQLNCIRKAKDWKRELPLAELRLSFLRGKTTRYRCRYRVVSICKARMDDYAFGILFSSALI